MLAVVTTHPIQYQVPIWKHLAARGKVPLKVYYLSDQGLRAQLDPGFGRSVTWDIDMLSGYDYEFAKVKKSSDQSSFWWLRLAENLGRRARNDGATTFWLHGWQVAAYWQAARQAQVQGLQLWLRGETNLKSTGQSVLGSGKRAILSTYLRRFDRFLYIGEANKKFYLSRGVQTERLASAPYCVDNARFSRHAAALRAERAAIRARWSIPQDAFCALFVGKLIVKKRPLDLIAAVARLQSERQVHMLFVGTGVLDHAVRNMCRVEFDASSNLASSSPPGAPKASFAGFLNQSEIAAAYIAADVLVLPSESTETWGLVANEAMACGLPIIVSNACGCSEDLVVPYRPDLCFQVGNINALSDSLLSVMRRPPMPSELAGIIERYDVTRTVESVERLYLSEQR